MLLFCLEFFLLPYLCFQLPHRPIFIVTTLKIFWSPAPPKIKDNIRSAYGETQLFMLFLVKP